MEKILVATDLSANSVSAIQYAYRLCQLKGAKLVIVHVYYISKPKSWRQHRYETYKNARKEFIIAKLNKFISKIFSNTVDPIINIKIDIQMHQNTVNTILKSAIKYKCKYICIGTHGSGKQKNLLGPTASKLLAKSPKPIICIPNTYNKKTIDSICYSSDLLNYQKEIKKIIEFVNPMDIEFKLLHITDAPSSILKTKIIETRLLKRTGFMVKMKYAQKKVTNTLLEDIDISVKKMKPAMVIFFINRSKNYSNSIFTPAQAKQLSFLKKLPVLIYKK